MKMNLDFSLTLKLERGNPPSNFVAVIEKAVASEGDIAVTFQSPWLFLTNVPLVRFPRVWGLVAHALAEQGDIFLSKDYKLS